MPSILDVAQTLVQYGALGVCLVIMIMIWIRKDREATAASAKLVETVENHKNEIVESERSHAREMMELAQQYDKTLTEINNTLEKMLLD